MTYLKKNTILLKGVQICTPLKKEVVQTNEINDLQLFYMGFRGFGNDCKSLIPKDCTTRYPFILLFKKKIKKNKKRYK